MEGVKLLIVDEIISYFDLYAWSMFIGFSAILACSLNIRKFGFKVIARYTVDHNPLVGRCISNITLQNMKDKTLIIDSVYVAFQNDLFIELKKYSSPLIIKPFEVVQINIDLYSYLTVNGSRYYPEYSDEVTIYLTMDMRLKACNYATRVNADRYIGNVAAHTVKFNDEIYNEHTRYIVSYGCRQQQFTTFVTEYGAFGGNPVVSEGINADMSNEEILLFLNQLFELKKIEFYECYEAPANIQKGNLRNIGEKNSITSNLS